MPPVSNLPVPSEKALREVIATLSREDLSEVEALVKDPLLARRLIDWLPEIFGLVLAPHIGKAVLPTRFSAMDARGRWSSFDFHVEPLFAPAMRIGAAMYHSSDRPSFGVIALRSSLVSVVNKVLNADQSLDGATFSGPAMIRIPAETYAPTKTPW